MLKIDILERESWRVTEEDSKEEKAGTEDSRHFQPSEYRTFGISNLRTIEPSDYRAVPPSTIDRIITLQLLLQTRHEYCRPLWILYVDLEAAFDSVNRDALWLLLLSLGLMQKLVDLFKALYTDTLSCVHADGCDSDWFHIGSGVSQGCVVAPDLLLTPMD